MSAEARATAGQPPIEMPEFDISTLPDEIESTFRIDALGGIRVSHFFRPILSEEVQLLRDRIENAGKGLTDDLRAAAVRKAAMDSWASIVIRVRGHKGAADLRGAELRAFFEDPQIPEGTSEVKAALWRDALRRSVESGLLGFFRSQRTES